MPEISATAMIGTQQWNLGPEACILPAGRGVISVVGSKTRNVLLDGQLSRLSLAGSIGLLGFDLTRSTGYHRLEVEGRVFWFGTADAKLRLEGVEAMLSHLRSLGTGWTGQALFSDGTGLRDAHVVYAWLDEHADRSLAAVSSILRSPHPNTTDDRVLRRRGGPRVLLSPTLRLLRSAPHRYLEENPFGLVAVAGSRYDPLRVVARRRQSTFRTPANIRAVFVLDGLRDSLVR